MARIAFVDHSFHQTTRSTAFLPAMLRRNGHVVDPFWDEGWKGGPVVPWDAVASHDVVIMFQSYCDTQGQRFRQAHPNVVYIPMLDQFGLWLGPMYNLSAFWEPFQGSKLLNFSNALHCMTTGFGIASHFVRFYPPAEALPAPRKPGLHGFFWLRRELQLNWAVVRKLIGDTAFDSFHIHLATDPGTVPAVLPPPEDVQRHNITTSTWFEDKSELEAVMQRANVYFAPRPGEGIGQSFLEAMGRGQCVVAPDQGTMNEYIVPGVNGLLYDLFDPAPLDFSDVAALGVQARAGTLAGRRLWEQAEQDLLRFVLASSESLYLGKYQHGAADPAPDAAPGLRRLVQRHPVFKATRIVWHPLLELARKLAGR
ncbi:glycosyltransferase [Variovorax sp. PAMC28562]|uniref:glycosyltransferase n=1 Tax=Variovorax sp. PAMC28562 TaxID=2762323 RepID=UPI00164DE6C2|nr:glycosyltransferase family 4 protein [Variovorax sp. PAMC28562]QNK75214.1 glycosyltransferase [Variovorax sp. PAMC28562]